VALFRTPGIFFTNQGGLITSIAFIGMLKESGNGHLLERQGCLWRSIEYEGIYLHAYTGATKARNASRPNGQVAA